MSTFGMMGLPVDNIVSPSFYTDVEFDKWIGYVSFASGYGLANNSERGYLGTAMKIGPVYAGLYYGGNFGYGYFRPDYYEMDVKGNTNPKGGAGGWSAAAPNDYKKFKVFQMPYNSTEFQFDVFNKDVSNTSEHKNDNRVILLIGLADMGFRLGYASTHTGYKGDDIAIEYDNDPLSTATNEFRYYEKFSIEHGWIVPQFAWGMARNLVPGGIRPSLSIDWGIARNFARYTDYQKTGEMVEYSKNYTEPVITANMNGYNYYEGGNGMTLKADFEYQLTLCLFNNDYSYGPITDLQTKSIKGFADRDTTGYKFTEYEFSSHRITPSTTLSWGQGNLDLKVGIYLPIILTSAKVSPMTVRSPADFSATGDLIHSTATADPETSAFDFSFAPSIDLAAQYRIIPQKLNLNLGGSFRQQGIGVTTTDYTEYVLSGGEAVVKENGQYKRTETNRGNFETAFHAGLTILFSEKFALDATTGIRNGRDINVFGTGADSITNFGSIMAMITF
jgi:hypothetical protein